LPDISDITHAYDLNADLEQVSGMLDGRITPIRWRSYMSTMCGIVSTVLLSVSLVSDVRGRPAYFISQIQESPTQTLGRRV